MRSPFEQKIKILRDKEGSGGFVDGIYQPAEKEPIEVFGSVQPANSHDTELLDAGKRKRQSFRIVTREALYAADDQLSFEADIAEIYGRLFRVEKSEPWQNGVNPHYSSIAVLMSGRAGEKETGKDNEDN